MDEEKFTTILEAVLWVSIVAMLSIWISFFTLSYLWVFTRIPELREAAIVTLGLALVLIAWTMWTISLARRHNTRQEKRKDENEANTPG